MKKIFLLIICFALMVPNVYAQDNLQHREFSVKTQSGSSLKLTVEYPIYNQARLRNLKCEIINNDKTLKISSNVQNLLKRRLIDAEVTVELLDKNQEIIQTLTTKVLPNAIKKNDRMGFFSIEADLPKNLSSCKIDLIWQGKQN